MRGLARGLDWTLALALVLIGFDVVFYFSMVAPATQHAEQLRSNAAEVRSVREQGPPAAPSDPRADLDAFHAALAQRQQVPDLLRRLHQAAARNGLVIDQADYRPLPDPGGRLTRYQFQIPARGTYPEIRRFLAQAAKEIPGLALDGVAFQRKLAGDEFVEAQFKFTLFVETGQAVASMKAAR